VGQEPCVSAVFDPRCPAHERGRYWSMS
jgi:hypothetical protein